MSYFLFEDSGAVGNKRHFDLANPGLVRRARQVAISADGSQGPDDGVPLKAIEKIVENHWLEQNRWTGLAGVAEDVTLELNMPSFVLYNTMDTRRVRETLSRLPVKTEETNDMLTPFYEARRCPLLASIEAKLLQFQADGKTDLVLENEVVDLETEPYDQPRSDHISMGWAIPTVCDQPGIVWNQSAIEQSYHGDFAGDRERAAQILHKAKEWSGSAAA